MKNLLKQFGPQKAVNDISFSINKGEIVGFLGPNGAGKSTTMKMITGYVAPDAGEISVAGIDVNVDPLSAKKKVGYLPESNALYYDMYVREYLFFIAGIHKVSNAKAAVDSVSEKVGLTPESRKKIGQLSKGYKQRVGLAAALIHNPEVLILDEPTSGLDPNQIVEIRNVIKEQGKDKLVLFSSHILQEVEAICDRVLIISKGKIVADDQLANLQKTSSSNIVKVSFKEKIAADKLKELAAASLVSATDEHNWQVTTNEPELLRKQIFEMALQQNLNIVSLQSEGHSLEEIFKTLTN
ncbi:MAG: gliding motility-associated ABC transporter ATP-binding subunit GldA [Bacteroidota bacterium]